MVACFIALKPLRNITNQQGNINHFPSIGEGWPDIALGGIWMGEDRRWMIPAILFVGVQHLVGLIVSARLDFDQRPPFDEYGRLFLSLTMAIVLFCLLVMFVQAAKAKAASPSRHMLGVMRAQAPRLPAFAVGLTLSWLQLVALTWYKAMIPLVSPMWADVPLADLDHALFGTDPGIVLQPILAPLATFFDLIYAQWAGMLKLSFLALLLLPPSRNRSIALLSFFLTIGLLGTWGQFLLPSGGPIFWEWLGHGDRFAGLEPPKMVLEAKAYLWSKYIGHTPDFASGISAFPSIHVASSAWMVIAAYLCMPGARYPFLIFFTLIAIGSVYTGWHYAVDGIAGALGALACLWLARLIVDLDWSLARFRPQPQQIA
jgi:membrane-associated phospholipid phosphatase